MRCRRNVRRLIAEYNAAAPANRPTTALARFRQALLALKAAPSGLAPPNAQASRYDDYVFVHQQSMAGHSGAGPHPGHRGPSFFPWHREFLRQFERDLRAVSGDPTICLPYWDWSADQDAADPGWPFFDDFLGGDGAGGSDVVATGPFARANGWVLNLNDDPGDALQREFGDNTATLPARADVLGALAQTAYDAAPWNTGAPATSFRNRVEGWVPAGTQMHNRVHVWVGGSMLPSTSPNDPVFFLNHVKEDQLWAVWMQKHPTVPHYLPRDSEPLPPGHTHLKRLSDSMDNLAEYFGAGTLDRAVDLLDHKAITWYDSDLPDIVLESGPSLGFNDTPAGLIAAKRIRFRVASCRPVYFSVTGAPTGNFSVFGGPDFTVTPVEANEFEILEVEVRFLAAGPNVQVSAVDIEARVVDEDGYYAANPGDPFTVATFHVELVADNIVTSDSSVVFVLDRSGSMADVANSGMAKHQLLKSAVGVAHAMMQDADQIGIARFDHEADVLLPMTVASAGLGTALTGGGLDPRGATSIGAGILVGKGLIDGPGATRPNKAMVILTDGNENTAPLIGTLPPGTIGQTTFAVGLGLPGQVSDPVLNQIAANSGGYLLVTGDLAGDAERFALAKFFLQILKDATRNQTVLDPQGLLLWGGAAQEIPFQIAETEVSLDVAVLCPLPQALEFVLVTPSGRTVTPATAATEPNVRYVSRDDVAYYRLMLPALLADQAGSHRGTWRAVLRLGKPEEVLKRLAATRPEGADMQEFLQRFRELSGRAVPYDLSVYAYSNLNLAATLRQDGFAPGATASLEARLFEYQLPLAEPAAVWAEIHGPAGASWSLPLLRRPDGAYAADFRTGRPGVYRAVVRAEGRTSGLGRFTRHKALTAGVWAGGDAPYDPQVDGGSSGPGGDCPAWLVCLLEQLGRSGELRERLKALGVDAEALLKCLEARCAGRPPMTTEPGRTPSVGQVPSTADLMRELARSPEGRRLISAMTATAPAAGLAVLEPSPARPVVRTPPRAGTPGNMFVREEDLPEMERRRRARKRRKSGGADRE